jgi:hypothetical protein
MRAIKENNKLIAEFLGYTQPHPDYPGATYWYKKDESPLTLLSFDSDWNWLMEVVDKIENLDFIFSIHHEVVNIFNGETKENGIYSETFQGSTKLITTYNACVEFIKWYNGQKQY